MKLELISFKLCPFTQQTVIALKLQKLDFKMTYINPMDPPAWFKGMSPTEQVPILKVDNQVIFESSVINEFINEISRISLHPNDPLKKAQNRAWIAFSATLFEDLFSLITGDEKTFNTAKIALFAKLDKVEAVKSGNVFFNGDSVNMVDVAFAPIFMRLDWINEFTSGALSIKQFPHLSAWSAAILTLDAVKKSVAEGLDDVYYSNIEGRSGYLSTQLVE